MLWLRYKNTTKYTGINKNVLELKIKHYNFTLWLTNMKTI